MTTVIRVWLAVAALVVLGVVLSFWADAWRSRERYQEPGLSPAVSVERLADLPAVLRESSGVAVSQQHPGMLWSHNDSGDGPVVYAIDAEGRLRASVTVDGARAEDWEDMALGPCPTETDRATSASCLFIADTGNNDATRSILTVWVIAEPSVLATGARTVGRGVRFRYPGPVEDSEAMAVAPDGDIVLVSKGRTGSIAFFRLGADEVRRALTTNEVLTASLEGDSGIEPRRRRGRLATGASLSPDARTLAVRTYDEIYFFTPSSTGGAWGQVGPACFLPIDEPVGEAVAYLDEQTLVLTSERSGSRPGALHRVRCHAVVPPNR